MLQIPAGYITAFLIGLLGGAHCVGMCGGIVSALSLRKNNATIIVKNQTQHNFIIHLAYNLGRISTYTTLGWIVGAIGSMGFLLNRMLPVQLAMYVLANLMLVMLGIYLIGLTRILAWPERIGHRIWNKLAPFAQKLFPIQRTPQAFAVGMVWGFLPCGLIYSVLTTALVTGSALRGGLLMLAFGLGTLPNLLLAGMTLKYFRDFTRHRAVRVIAGCIVIIFGVWGLVFAPQLGGKLWSGAICHV